eukprot:COSAG03_NODE_11549_length_587_cov_0.809426_1_plen_72_part_01
MARITRTDETNGDLRLSGTANAVWHTALVSGRLAEGAHYAEFRVATDPETGPGTGRSWMVGVARPTDGLRSA